MLLSQVFLFSLINFDTGGYQKPIFSAYGEELKILVKKGGYQNSLRAAYSEDISLKQKLSKKSFPKPPAKEPFSPHIVKAFEKRLLLVKKLSRGGCQNPLLTAYYEDISLKHKISKKSFPKAPAKPPFSQRIVRENFSALGGYKTPIFPAYSGGLFLQQKLSSFFQKGPL